MSFSEMDKITWESCPTTTNAVERKNQDCKQSQPLEIQAAFVNVYRMDKAACLQHIAACEQVRLSYRSTTQEAREKQAAQKRKERDKRYPEDRQALQGPPDKTSNFMAKKSKCKQFLEDEDFQPKQKKQCSNSPKSQPDTALLFQKCKVLYAGNKWYEGTITGVEFCTEKKQWMYNPLASVSAKWRF